MTQSFGEFLLFPFLFVVFLIEYIGTDIETHSLCRISHSYNGLSFFEGKIDLRRLRG